MKIDFAKLQYQYQLYKTEIDEAIQSLLDKSNYIMGNEIRELEGNLELQVQNMPLLVLVEQMHYF